MQDNVQLVQQIYAAIGRGDVPAVIDMMADDIEIHVPGPSEIPFAGTYRGHEGVGQYFHAIGTNTDILQFEPRDFIAQDDQVVVVGDERLRSKSTDRSWETGWAMVWTVRDGKVAVLREFHQTAAIADAFR